VRVWWSGPGVVVGRVGVRRFGRELLARRGERGGGGLWGEAGGGGVRGSVGKGRGGGSCCVSGIWLFFLLHRKADGYAGRSRAAPAVSRTRTTTRRTVSGTGEVKQHPHKERASGEVESC